MNDAFHNLKMKIKNALQVYINKAVKKKKVCKENWLEYRAFANSAKCR